MPSGVVEATHPSQALPLPLLTSHFSRSPWTSTMPTQWTIPHSQQHLTQLMNPLFLRHLLYLSSRPLYSPEFPCTCTCGCSLWVSLVDSPSSWPLNIGLPQDSVISSLLFSINILFTVELISPNVLNISISWCLLGKYRMIVGVCWVLLEVCHHKFRMFLLEHWMFFFSHTERLWRSCKRVKSQV